MKWLWWCVFLIGLWVVGGFLLWQIFSAIKRAGQFETDPVQEDDDR